MKAVPVAPAAPEAGRPLHKPFSFLRDELRFDPHGSFMETTLNICQGIGLCLELVHTSTLEAQFKLDDPTDAEGPLLSEGDADRMLRFAMTATALLADRAERGITHKNEYFKTGGAL